MLLTNLSSSSPAPVSSWASSSDPAGVKYGSFGVSTGVLFPCQGSRCFRRCCHWKYQQVCDEGPRFLDWVNSSQLDCVGQSPKRDHMTQCSKKIVTTLTLIKASLLASRLRGGVFSSSEDREREGVWIRFAVCGIRVDKETDCCGAACGATIACSCL